MMKKTLLTGALVALIGAGVLLSIRASRTEFVQEVATAPVYADEQEVAQEPKPEPKTAKKAPKAVTWQDNPNQCTKDQWIDEQAPYNCIDKAVEQVASVARSEVTPSQNHPIDCEAYRSLIEQYDWDIDTMMYAMQKESGCNSSAVGDQYVIGGVYAPSCGLLQVRTLAGRPSCEALKDPSTNIATAYQIWQGQGYMAWSVLH